MSVEDDRRALDRFVAGLPVDPDALAIAITAKAVDRTIVVDALLKGLADPTAAVRRRTALRIGRMPEADPRLAARLGVLADADDDPGTREASAASLRAHGLPVPGEGEDAAASSGAHAPWVLLRASVARSATRRIEVAARYASDAPQLDGDLVEDPGGARADLRGLPPEFAGTRPALRAARAPGPLTAIGTAEAPVSPDGSVTIRIPLEDTSFDDLVDWVASGVDLVVPAD